MLTTTDGGVTWISETAPGSPWLRSAAFANETGGWAVGLSGDIVHLTRRAWRRDAAAHRRRRAPTTAGVGRRCTLTLAATDPSGVARTEARIDGGAWLPRLLVSSSTPRPRTRADGLHRVDYRSLDTVGNTESYHSTEVRIDTRRPTTKAPRKAGVRQAGTSACTTRSLDPLPCATKATVTIKIKTLGGTPVKTLRLGLRTVNSLRSYSFKCTLPKRTYRYWVYATDAAGNTQSSVGRNYLVVR